MDNVLAILLAGGLGERLYPLTRNTAKPGVPFGGVYRIIDFTLSNCINSDVRKILILTQFKSLELHRHIRNGWNILSQELGEYIEIIPPMKRASGSDWYLGTADAVFQNIASIDTEQPDQTLILSADHIYKMNYHHMVDLHRSKNACVTIATTQVAPEEASRFGVVQIDSDFRILGFQEKPKDGSPSRSAFNPAMVSVSMGIYCFETSVLLDEIKRDAENPDSAHDFGKDILPACLARERNVVAYDFVDMNAKKARYWRDVGTIDAFYEANMDLCAVTPEFNLYDGHWPVHVRTMQQPPAKFVFADEGVRMGEAIDSIVSPGCIISGGRVLRSVLSPGVRVHSYSLVENSILMPNVTVGRYSRVRRAILDHGVNLPRNTTVGFDRTADLAKGYIISEGGVTVVPALKLAARHGIAFGIALLGAAYAFQRPFREYAGVEYSDFPLPPDSREKTEWVFARLMYPSAPTARFARWGADWRTGQTSWTQDYPRADRHFSSAIRRLTRIHVRSVEQPVSLDDGDDVFDYPWLYAVQVGEWKLTDAQARKLREYLLRGGFFMADDFWGIDEWAVFKQTMERVFPDRPIVEIADRDAIFHTIYDLDDRYQVPGEWALRMDRPYRNNGADVHWRGIFDDRGRIMVAISLNSDLGDSWEWADAPHYPEKYSALGIRIGVNYVVYAMTH